MRTIKKIITLAITAILLGLQILTPAISVIASEDSTEFNSIEDVDDETAYLVGKLVTTSQGGRVWRRTGDILGTMQDFGRDLLRNAYDNGTRIGDIIGRNGRDFMFNPTQLLPIIDNTYSDFVNNELTWINENRAIIDLGQNFYWAEGEEIPQNTTEDIDLTEFNIPFEPRSYHFQGENMSQFRFRIVRINSTGSYTTTTVNPSSINDTSSIHTVSDILTTKSHVAIDHRSRDMSIISSIDKLTLYKEPITAAHETGMTHIPDEPPAQDEIITNFSSTFTDIYDEDTNQYYNTWYTYNADTFINDNVYYSSVSTINNITNIEKGDVYNFIDNSETTIIHEADEEGGGTFWRAILSLLETLITSIANLGSSIADAIGMLFEPLFSFLTNIFDWLTWFEPEYIETNINEIQTGFTDKFPDFTQVIDTEQTISTEAPEMTVDFEFMGLGQQQVMDISPYEPYIPYLKGILRAFMYLSTAVIVFVKITGGGLND